MKQLQNITPQSAIDSTATSGLMPGGKAKSEVFELMDLISFENIAGTFLVFFICWLMVKLVKFLLNFFAERSTLLRIRIKSLIPGINLILWATAVYIVIVGIINPPNEALLAAGASVGIALGFAAQDILKNIFAGFVILLDTPFKMGDKIQVGDYYGEVKTIGLRSTKIISPDDSLITIPNADLMNNSVSNANSGEPNCQVVAEFWLPESIQFSRVREIATEAAQVSPYIYLNKPIAVLFFHELKHDKPMVKMRLKAYVLDIRSEFQFKSDMTERVIKRLKQEKIISPNGYDK